MSHSPEIAPSVVEEGHVETPWSVRASVTLLLLQLLLFLGLAGLSLWATAVSTWDALWEGYLAGDPLLYFILALLLLSLWAGVALWKFYRLRHRGWLYAMLSQTFCLLLGLIAYFASKSVSAQLLLLSGIIMTVYLHNPETKAAFRVRNGSEEAELLD